MWPHVYAFMHMCMGSVCSYAVWLTDTIALAVMMCWELFSWFVEQKYRKDAQRKRNRAGGAMNRLVDLSLYQHSPASSLPSFTLSPLLYSQRDERVAARHRRGPRATGLCIGDGLVQTNLPILLDCLKRMWSFSWGERWRAVRKGFSAACPSLLTLLDGRAATICGRRGRPPDRTALPTKCLSLQPCALKADACCDLLTV